MAYRILESCNGCSACYGQCPTQAIEGVFEQWYRVVATRCIDCGVCGMVCPIEAVVDGTGALAQRVPRAQRMLPLTNPDLCNGCASCVERCPFDCRGILGPRYYGLSWLSNPDLCVSCGECVEACPRAAIDMIPRNRPEQPWDDREQLQAVLSS